MRYKSTNLEPASALVDLVYCMLSLSTAMLFELCRSRVEIDCAINSAATGALQVERQHSYD